MASPMLPPPVVVTSEEVETARFDRDRARHERDQSITLQSQLMVRIRSLQRRNHMESLSLVVRGFADA